MNRGGGPSYTIVGPCVCKGCGSLVYWAHSVTRSEWNGKVIKGSPRWRDAGGRIHKCGEVSSQNATKPRTIAA